MRRLLHARWFHGRRGLAVLACLLLALRLLAPHLHHHDDQHHHECAGQAHAPLAIVEADHRGVDCGICAAILHGTDAQDGCRRVRPHPLALLPMSLARVADPQLATPPPLTQPAARAPPSFPG